MFHILETRPTKMHWCWLARERGTSTAYSLVSTVLVLRVATLGGCRNPARCGTPCALWNTTSAATSLQCSSKSRGLTGLGWTGGSAASTNRRARRWMLSSLLVCEAAHDIQERAAYSKLIFPYLYRHVGMISSTHLSIPRQPSTPHSVSPTFRWTAPSQLTSQGPPDIKPPPRANSLPLKPGGFKGEKPFKKAGGYGNRLITYLLPRHAATSPPPTPPGPTFLHLGYARRPPPPPRDVPRLPSTTHIHVTLSLPAVHPHPRDAPCLPSPTTST
ncbi:hypothetical protein GWK47_035729 [Chionoecetes opilio]|uniref:Uncharacterized protein n=1 Tax=Chionoecetes opilio TaxID=41210 RepID=A0A8J4YPZ1_CHIOP|nr:hypothetical protein GWK47_035729 [Chionoecetes opilio]